MKEETSVIDLELPKDRVLELAMEAHKQNITLNQHVTNLIKNAIADIQKDAPVCQNCGTNEHMVPNVDNTWTCHGTHTREAQ